MMPKLQLRYALVALAVAASLGGCGGGGDGGDSGPAPAPERTTDVPASARQSVSGLLAYMNELIGMTSSTSEPILVGDAVLPTDDAAEPAN